MRTNNRAPLVARTLVVIASFKLHVIRPTVGTENLLNSSSVSCPTFLELLTTWKAFASVDKLKLTTFWKSFVLDTGPESIVGHDISFTECNDWERSGSGLSHQSSAEVFQDTTESASVAPPLWTITVVTWVFPSGPTRYKSFPVRDGKRRTQADTCTTIRTVSYFFDWNQPVVCR